MRPIRTAILSLVIVATAAGCASVGAATPSQAAIAATSAPTAVPTVAPTPEPTVAPTAAPTATAAPSHDQTISLYEWKVIAAETLTAGKTTFTISNFGTIPHELLIFKSKLDLSAYPKDKAGDIIEDGPGVTLLSDGENVDPTGAQVRTVNLTPGTYVFMCNIPGHFKQGMYTVVTVTK
jgi:uncharacterized cupredoxin-like copper-binding protein